MFKLQRLKLEECPFVSVEYVCYMCDLWLQSTSMAYGKVTEDTVYTCTGHPLRSDIANILDWALNKDFTTAYKRILNLLPPFPKIQDGFQPTQEI